MLKYTLNVSKETLALLQTMRALQFGDIYGAEVHISHEKVSVELSRAERDLVNLIESGVQYFDVLTVHHGNPVMAEIDEKNGSFRCRKKVRFPTENPEG